MKNYTKRDFPVSDARRFLEPSPTVLLSSAYKDKQNMMAFGWYSILEFTPSLVGCMISGGNYSFDLIRKSKTCVINIPTLDLVETVVKIGNCTGAEIDKFAAFGLTAQASDRVNAPLVKECYANFECQLYDDEMVDKYNYFIFEIVKAHVAITPKFPETFQYRGDSQFVASGKNFKVHSDK